MTKYFVTAIDTDSGKTFVSAILCEALKADYWKPIQAGLPRDTDRIRELVTNQNSTFHSERFVLNTPASPHAAAKIDNKVIRIEDFSIPVTKNSIIVEGAGGCMVPINDDEFVIDIIKRLGIETIVVADLYLGSINHTLLTIEALKRRSIPLLGLIFNGESNPESERIILKHTGLRCLLKIPKLEEVNRNVVAQFAAKLKEQMQWTT